MPVFFRSVRVGREPDTDWFLDGGTRLNTPIKPALDLGVDRVGRLGRVVAEVYRGTSRALWGACGRQT